MSPSSGGNVTGRTSYDEPCKQSIRITTVGQKILRSTVRHKE